jgi:hypothetical protein
MSQYPMFPLSHVDKQLLIEARAHLGMPDDNDKSHYLCVALNRLADTDNTKVKAVCSLCARINAVLEGKTLGGYLGTTCNYIHRLEWVDELLKQP